MLAMIQAYMDESCDKEQTLFAIGGFLGRSDAWIAASTSVCHRRDLSRKIARSDSRCIRNPQER
jgi:hypothetical protein